MELSNTKTTRFLDLKGKLGLEIKHQTNTPEVERILSYIKLERDSHYKRLLQYCDGSPESTVTIGKLKAYQELIDLIGKNSTSPKLDS